MTYAAHRYRSSVKESRILLGKALAKHTKITGPTYPMIRNLTTHHVNLVPIPHTHSRETSLHRLRTAITACPWAPEGRVMVGACQYPIHIRGPRVQTLVTFRPHFTLRTYTMTPSTTLAIIHAGQRTKTQRRDMVCHHVDTITSQVNTTLVELLARQVVHIQRVVRTVTAATRVTHHRHNICIDTEATPRYVT